jgi:23S rRNA (cytidine1920-2'-O)/16S rRNA (cytidine1409-2'-O)-methyltransferase
MARRQRLDAELVRRRLCTSRAEADVAIAAGRVLVNGAPAVKAARQVHAGDAIVLTGDPPRFVSRGGEKLDAALAGFGIDVTGRRALDAGASTGGFTDCLLQRGASEVVAVDVGHGQLHPRIRGDPRVSVLERFHVNDLSAGAIGGAVDIVVADLSFISLTRVVDALLRVARPGADLVLLVKPQFEAGRAEASRGRGVITDPAVHDRVRREVEASLTDRGCTIRGWIDSPIAGGSGNREFLVYATAAREGCGP